MIPNNVISPNVRNNVSLHRAIVEFKGLNIITTLLDRGANIHAQNHHRQKPLEIAIQINNTQAALLLIRRGALVGEDLNSFLIMAIEKNNDLMVKMLIDYGMQNNPTIDLKIALDAAISQGQPKIIEYILPCCRFLNPSDKYIPKETVICSGTQCKKCVELLLKWNFTVNPDSKNDEEFVYTTVENGHLPIVSQLLELGIDVNMMNPYTGLNLLKVACFNSHHEIVENLLKHNAGVNVTTPTNTAKLNTKAHYNSNYLISSVQDTNDLRDITCLHIAVLNSDPKMTKLLLRYGATIIDDPEFFNITRIAVLRNCEDIVRTFLEHGLNVNSIDHRGKTLLQRCVHFDFTEKDFRYNMAKLLLEKGANINIQTSENSLLFKAIDNQHYKIAELFLKHNADIQYINRHGDTLLHKAIQRDFDVEFIKTLLKFKLPVNAVNDKKFTPLHNACRYYFENTSKTLKSIETLLDYNVNVNCADCDLMTPLHFACNLPKPEIVTVLLQNGANPDAKNNEGQTSLHFVCKYNTNMTQNIIQLLLQYKANIEAVDIKGWTPLFLACYSSNDKAVTCLLDHYANGNHIDLEQLTPLYIAAKNCKYNSEIIKILLEHKVNVHCMDKRRNSIIHVVVNQDNEELIKSLARTQINFNSINKRGNTPLHIAVQKKSAEMIKELIKYGANVNILDKKKRTPLRNAMEYMFHYQRKVDNCVDPLFRQSRSWDYSDYSDYDDDDNYSDSDVTSHRPYVCKVKKYQKIIEVLKIQVIKLKVARLKVNSQNLDLVYNSDNDDEDVFVGEIDFENPKVMNRINIVRLELKCWKEIKTMKTENIGFNNITFYDLLTRNIHLLSRFVKNKNIRQTLNLEVYDKKFPLYMDIIRSRFRDAKFRYRMMNSAKIYFISNINHRLSEDSIDTVFSYLNIKDLKMLIRAMKPLDV